LQVLNLLLSQTLKKKGRKRRWWVTNLMQQRIVDNLDETMADMQEQEVVNSTIFVEWRQRVLTIYYL